MVDENDIFDKKMYKILIIFIQMFEVYENALLLIDIYIFLLTLFRNETQVK